MMAVAEAALTDDERAMPREISRKLYLYAAIGQALVRVGLARCGRGMKRQRRLGKAPCAECL
jgi:hypothetical protein